MNSRKLIVLAALALISTAAFAATDCDEPLVSFEAPGIDPAVHGIDIAAGPDGNFLVASDGTAFGTLEIFDRNAAVLVDSEGATRNVAILPRNARPIDMTVSADSTGYLLFWTESHHRAEPNLHVARLDLAGELLWTRALSTGPGWRATNLDAAFYGGHHLLAWSATDFVLRAQPFSPDGTVAGAAVEIGRAASCSWITVAAGEGFAVAWSVSRLCDTAYEVVPHPAPSHLAFLDSRGDVRSAGILDEKARGATVSWSSDHWVTASAMDDRVTLRRFDADGIEFADSSSVLANWSMNPSIAWRDGEAALVWYSDYDDSSGMGTRFEVLVSTVDEALGISPPAEIGSAYESYVPSPGNRFVRPITAAACNEAACLVLSGASPAALVDHDDRPRLLGGFDWQRPPIALSSFDAVSDDQYLLTLTRYGVLHLVALAEDGRILRERRLTEAPYGNGRVTITVSQDGRHVLVTQFENGRVYGWFVDAVTLEPVAERVLIPFGEIVGGVDSFLIAWQDHDASGYSLHLAIFGLDGNVRAAERVSSGKEDVRVVAGWLGDRFGVFAPYREDAAVYEIGESGPPVATHPIDIEPFTPYARGSGDGMLFAASSNRVIEIGPGGVVDVRPFGFGGLRMSRLDAVRWMGEWRVRGYFLSVQSETLMVDEAGDQIFPADWLIEVDGDELLAISARWVEDRYEIAVQRFGSDEPGPSCVGFASPGSWVSEGVEGQRIALKRTGSTAEEAVVRLEVDWAPATAQVPIRIDDPVIRFAPGEVVRLIPVTVFDDSVFADWNVRIGIEPLTSGLTLGEAEQVVTVEENDLPLLIPVRDAIREGNETRTEVIELNLNGEFAAPTYVDVHVADRSGLYVGTDIWSALEPFHRSILVEPGQRTIEIPLVIYGDEAPDESGSIVIEYWYGGDPWYPNDGRAWIEVLDDDLGRRKAVRRR